MESHNQASEMLDFLSNHFLFQSIDELSFVHLLSHVKKINVKNGDYVVHEGDPADNIFLIQSGKVFLFSKGINKEEDNLFGVEAALGSHTYDWSAQAQSDLTLYTLEKDLLTSLLCENNEVSCALTRFYQTSLIEGKKKTKATDTTETSCTPQSKNPKDTKTPSVLREISAWLSAFIVPIVVYYALSDMTGQSHRAQLLLSVISSGFTLWCFNILPLFVPALLVLLVSLGLGLVPAKVILSGFSSDAFIAVLSLSTIQIIVFGSGLLTRVSIYIMDLLPKKQTWLSFGIYMIGFIITPIVPSVLKRTAFMGKMTNDMIATLRIKPDSEMSIRLAVSSFFGAASFSSHFFTGSIINFIAFSLLPIQTSHEVTSIGWFTASIVPFVVIFLTNILAIPLLFQARERSIIDGDILKEQLKALGPVKVSEWYALAASIFFACVIFTMSAHQINIITLGLFLLFSFVVLKMVRINNWEKETDWSFLMFVCTSIGIFAALDTLEFNRLISENITPVIKQITTTPVGVITLAMFLTIGIRLFLSIGPTFLLMMYLSLPIASAYNIDLWVISFTILSACDIWFFSYQSDPYQFFKKGFTTESACNNKSFFAYALLINLFKIISIFISIPYWRYLGLI